ncbi:S1 RNA-binding domain-containing protein [Enterococcus saccharolyticus]|uniref:General stress protein n=1 Tax=Candidatus Enterococcus willemsii TaxID=1857215 RepID=A0ABQ6Z3A8_9ENTE|nr:MULTISPECIES: CvfD/Ygs/GSP13 family RNA-binding post-transcriptional regulator [Enterococcus]KAF1305839.1 general stress protein [Enterococcus sp. CU12B]MCD5003069.1 S1 RNA-binding domain-containing protein [Enterococcus saccharolyticus]
MTYRIGNTLEGTVTGIQPYGAFVSLDDETQGLIHVSEIQSGFTKNIHEVLQVGDSVNVQVIDIDEYTKKISLSRRTLETKFVHTGHRKKRYFTNKNKRIGFRTIDEQLPIWTKEALEMLSQENF